MKSLYNNPFILILIIITLIAFGYLNRFFPTIDLSEVTPTNILTVLGYLFVIVLVVEQFVEIFIHDANVKDKIEAKLRIQQIDEICQDIDNPDDQLIAMFQEKKEIIKDLEVNQLKRKQRILFITFSIGLLLSFSGFRILSGFLFDNSLGIPVENTQAILIQSIDIILTAGIISGGSDNVHQLLKRIKSGLSV